jgi:endoglycosylceramidase
MLSRSRAVAAVITASLALSVACSSSSSSTGPSPSDPLPALRAVPDVDGGGRIVDVDGREVLLRGVNVNAYVEYWQYDEALFTVYPFSPTDADQIASMGWTLVRLLLSWSRVEPSPGVYDEAYLDQIASAVALLRERGIYTLIDLHQDAWNATLAAPPDETCPEGTRPAGGWDGAPGWATFDGDRPRCELGAREVTPSVLAAWGAWFDDVVAEGGVGIRTRYVDMFAHVVARFANDDSVVGFDVMNEPGVLNTQQNAVLSSFYEDALSAMRAAEREAGTPTRLFVFEPAVAWAETGLAGPPPFDQDDQVVYSPHIYQGGIAPGTLEEGFERAADEAATLYEGAPVVTGEWGSDPNRAADPDDDYFERHFGEQDRYRYGAALWTWREACGDPHKYNDTRDGRVPEVWGFFEVDCETNTIDGERDALTEVMRRMTVRFAPGPIGEVLWTDDDTELRANGSDAPEGNRLEIFVPTNDPSSVDIETTGLEPVEATAWHGGTLYYARAEGGAWSIALRR